MRKHLMDYVADKGSVVVNLSICTNNEPLCLAYTLPSDEPSKEPSEPSLFDELAG